MEYATEQTVGEIVAKDYRTAGVFKKYGLDFCCGGGRSLAAACEKKGLQPEALLRELNALGLAQPDAQNYDEWGLGFLIDYIINNHHHFVRRKLPEIEAYAHKVAKVHGGTYPQLKEMRDLFLVLKSEMLDHLDKEESYLFPYIKKLEALEAAGGKIEEKPDFGTVGNPVRMMEEEHDHAGSLVAQLSELSDGFTPPEDACATFRVYFKNLEGFQDDLHKHVHLENNILFPKALKLEQQLR